jgi:hypothetical protein
MKLCENIYDIMPMVESEVLWLLLLERRLFCSDFQMMITLIDEQDNETKMNRSVLIKFKWNFNGLKAGLTLTPFQIPSNQHKICVCL